MLVYHTDGSCRPTNPGPGGYAVIRDGRIWEFGYEPVSTNIRMEGQAMLTALHDANHRECVIYSDSEFWINVLTKWAPGWKAKGWKKSSGEIKNLALVMDLYANYLESNAKLVWVKGHANDEGNILADKYALVASGSYQNTDESDRLIEEAMVQVWKNHAEFAPDESKPGWCGTCQEITDVSKSTK